MTPRLTYVLVTPAWNEAQFIELTLKSVVSQTVRPARWVIVSDGSTDGTDDIVRKYSAEHPWIELIRMPESRERNFARKVNAFNAGYRALQGVDYDVIASLDGDISFDADYFAFLLQKLEENPGLGLVGTPFKDGSKDVYDYRFVSIEHVSGACQVFRRQCFEEIGGYVPVKGGGIDLIAVLTARMKGWKTRTFTEKICHHHREMGTAQNSSLSAWYKNGVKDHSLGCHPLWELSRVIYQMSKPPYILGGSLLLAGYASATIRRSPRAVSPSLMEFRRREQMERLRRFIFGQKPPAEQSHASQETVPHRRAK
ncbi:MAG TPA: glycosyltransferase family A protein [Dongiaceae bacterium]|nr:glycosyltransferase family A protein [Dongiaceae bacterium]